VHRSRNMNEQVRELHALLAGARVAGPYVFGRLLMRRRIARVYAMAYPREVDGIVLIDPATFDDFGRVSAAEQHG
jgi:pimeloyl-ACP methyl ester carboxylesterase